MSAHHVHRTAGFALLALVIGCSNPKRETCLHETVRDGTLEEVAALLDQGAEINVRDEGGATPLHVAVYRGDLDIARLLIERGADVHAADRDNDTPLSFTADRDMIRLLQTAGRNRTPAAARHAGTDPERALR